MWANGPRLRSRACASRAPPCGRARGWPHPSRARDREARAGARLLGPSTTSGRRGASGRRAGRQLALRLVPALVQLAQVGPQLLQGHKPFGLLALVGHAHAVDLGQPARPRPDLALRVAQGGDLLLQRLLDLPPQRLRVAEQPEDVLACRLLQRRGGPVLAVLAGCGPLSAVAGVRVVVVALAAPAVNVSKVVGLVSLLSRERPS
jgi:hypothetical protein